MDEEYEDIIYVDSRNAVVRDHTGSRRPSVPWRPAPPRPARVVPMTPTRTVYVPPQGQPYYGAPTAPMIYAQPGQPYGAPVMYPPTLQGTAASILGKLTTGQIIEMIAQAFAAMQSLPAAPVTTRDLDTDVQNLVTYQTALATHAKRDEQYRTLGGLVAKLVG